MTRAETRSKKNLTFIIVIMILFIISGLAYLILQYRNSLELKKPLNLLLMGMDKNMLTPGSHDDPHAMPRTDTLILALIDPLNGKISMISIPRDSLVDFPGHGVDRINYASVKGGIPLTRQMVSKMMGCKIDRYMLVNFESFKHLVDLVGGVEINVDKKMRYADEYGVYKIKLDPGRQVLNGEKALQYVRFRNEPLGDISRVERQRILLRAIYKKLNQPSNITKLPSLMGLARKYMKTDLSSREMVALVNFTRQINPEQDIRSYTLPGSFYEVYWQPDPKKVRELMVALRPVAAGKTSKALPQKK